MNEQEKTIVKNIKLKPYKIANAVGFNDVIEYPHNEWMQALFLVRMIIHYWRTEAVTRVAVFLCVLRLLC